MKKVLMLASVASMIDQFNMSNIDILKELGYEVHIAANFRYGNTSSEQRMEEFKNELEKNGIPYYNIGFARDVTQIFRNIKAYKELIALMQENNYEFIHCHSPIGGVCGRIASRNIKTKVIYTAHGFHFYKGSPIINWIIYYPVEKFLAKYTDILITINQEDYALAKKAFIAKEIVYLPGIGIDLQKFSGKAISREEKCKELGVPIDAFILLSVGELIKRKNHKTVIKAISKLSDINVIYLICGKGNLDNYLKNLARKLDIEDKVKFLGFRTDVSEICAISDLYVFPSYQEGLPVALMEAMASGLAVVCSNIRGNTDLIKDGEGGYLCNPNDINEFAKLIEILVKDKYLIELMARNNKETIKNFEATNVKKLMHNIYAKIGKSNVHSE